MHFYHLASIRGRDQSVKSGAVRISGISTNK